MKKRMSLLLTMVLVFSLTAQAFAIDAETFQAIRGNTMIVGTHLFDLNTNEKDFNLNNFMNATKTVTGPYNNIFYKNMAGDWFELVSDADMVDGITSATALSYLPDAFTAVYGSLDGSGQVTPDQGTGQSTIINTNLSDVLNIEQVYYGVIVLNSGTADDYNFTLGGSAFTPSAVSDNKKVVKFEVNPTEKVDVTLSLKANPSVSESISLGTGQKAFTGLITNEAPVKILANGAIDYFAYYLDNYDANGNVRTHIQKTTFDTENEGVAVPNTSLPVLSSQRTLLGDDISITAKGDNVLQWLGNIYKVQKDYGTTATSRVDVSFRVEDGGITVLANSTALLDRNGKHDLIIYSNGFEDVRVTIELIEPAGSLNLAGEFNYWANQDLLFELTDFNYAVTNPIYEVVLDGVVLQGDCVHYHVVSNFVRLENEALSMLGVGTHTLTVKAEGFADYTKTFYLDQALNGQQNPVWGEGSETLTLTASPKSRAVIDGVSAASAGSSSGGSAGTESGSAINTSLIFDFDMLANAMILTHLGKATPYATEVLAWWRATSHDAVVSADGNDKLVDYTYYKNNAGMASGTGDFVTFKAYYNGIQDYTGNMTDTQDPALYLNRPYSVKTVLEDGLLGSVIAFGETNAKDAPVLSSETNSYYGEDIVLYYTGSDVDTWLNSIVRIMLNTYSYVTNYVVDREAKTITIPASNAITAGTNYIEVVADGYKTSSISLSVTKQNASELVANVSADGSVMISGMTQTYMNDITSIQLNGAYLFNDSQYGTGKGQYEIIGNTIKLRNTAFTANGEQILTIYATGYENSILRFSNNNVSEGETPKAEVPTLVALHDENSYQVGEAVAITTGTMFDTSYGEKNTQVTVNNVVVENQEAGFWPEANFLIGGNVFVSAGTYKIVIQAEGYQDKEFSINITDSKLAVPSYVTGPTSTISYGNSATITLSSYTDETYVNKIIGATIDGEYREVASLGISGFSQKTMVLTGLSVGVHSVVLHAEGYEDKTISITVVGASVPSIVKLAKNGTMDSNTSITASTGDVISVVVGDAWSSSYKAKLTHIVVNDNTVTDFTYTTITYMGSDYDAIIIPAQYLVEGDNNISFFATGYADKVFAVQIG